MAAFSFATARASDEMSVPTPRAAGRSLSTASRIAPEPVPRSIIWNASPCEKAARATSMMVSVSGRGLSTSGVTFSMIFQNPLRPRMRDTGSRRSRRSIMAS